MNTYIILYIYILYEKLNHARTFITIVTYNDNPQKCISGYTRLACIVTVVSPVTKFMSSLFLVRVGVWVSCGYGVYRVLYDCTYLYAYYAISVSIMYSKKGGGGEELDRGLW